MKHAVNALRSLMLRAERAGDLDRKGGCEGLAAVNDEIARDCREALGVLAEHHARAMQAAIDRCSSGGQDEHKLMELVARDALLCP